MNIKCIQWLHLFLLCKNDCHSFCVPFGSIHLSYSSWIDRPKYYLLKAKWLMNELYAIEERLDSSSNYIVFVDLQADTKWAKEKKNTHKERMTNGASHQYEYDHKWLILFSWLLLCSFLGMYYLKSDNVARFT